jgi:pyroglutamyl-peptidase
VTVLLTGFEPFGGETSNPSWDAVQLVAEHWDRPEELVTAELPVVFGEAERMLRALIAEHEPHLVLCVGQAGGNADLRLERVAVNLADARIPDNSGAHPMDEALDPHGPAAYLSELPLKAALARLTDAGIPASVSLSAGTFVCNAVLYALLASGVRGGFVHVPYAPGQIAAADAPTMEVAQTARGIRVALDTYAGRISRVGTYEASLD